MARELLSKLLKLCALSLVSVTFGCAPEFAMMTVELRGMRAALGVWRDPVLVNIVMYAPRPAGTAQPTVMAPEPGWNPMTTTRRITAWDGEDTQRLVVGWPRGGPVTSLQVQAQVAAGPCGTDRVVLAEASRTGIAWNEGDPGLAFDMRRVVQTLYADPTGACR
jgi:hypothetical protein